MAVRTVQVAWRAVGKGREGLCSCFRLSVHIFCPGRVESRTDLGFSVRNVVGARASGVVDDHFGLIFAAQLEGTGGSCYLRVVLARTQRIGRLLIATFASPKTPIFAGSALPNGGLRVEAARSWLLFITLVDIVLLSETETPVRVLPKLPNYYTFSVRSCSTTWSRW